MSDPTRKMGQNEYYDKVYKAKLVSLDLGSDREAVAGGERRGSVTCARTLCGLGQRDRDWS